MAGIFGRDEMNALIGGPANGDGAEEMAAFRQTGGQPNIARQSSRGTAANEVDISKMTAAETATMLSDKAKSSGSNSNTRYRSKNKVLAHHQLLAEELSKQQFQQQQQKQQQQKPTTANNIPSKDHYSDDNDDDNGEFLRERRPVQAAVVATRRCKEPRRRRRRSYSSSSSSSSSGESQKRARRNECNRNNRRERRRKDDESSSSSSSDEEDGRRRNQRVLASRRMQEEPETIVPKSKAELDAKKTVKGEENSVSAEEKVVDHEHERKQEQQPQVEERIISKPMKRTGTLCATHSSSDDEEESDGSLSSSSGSSSSSSSSSSEEDEPVRLKPTFVPKHKRNLIQSEEKKLEEEELKHQLDKECNLKRKAESRALVAKELALAVSSFQNDADDDLDEECGGATNAPPNDDDDLGKEKERNAWEIRELERLLKSIDEQELRRKEEEEYSRRKKLTDAECLKEDIESGRYQAPGASRENESSGSQRFFHRGAYYMDKSEWDEGDIRQKAVEYAEAATGEDKIDKSKLPEVMQVKKFGRARQNTKYKGLAKEDTTDQSAHFLP